MGSAPARSHCSSERRLRAPGLPACGPDVVPVLQLPVEDDIDLSDVELDDLEKDEL